VRAARRFPGSDRCLGTAGSAPLSPPSPSPSPLPLPSHSQPWASQSLSPRAPCPPRRGPEHRRAEHPRCTPGVPGGASAPGLPWPGAPTAACPRTALPLGILPSVGAKETGPWGRGAGEVGGGGLRRPLGLGPLPPLVLPPELPPAARALRGWKGQGLRPLLHALAQNNVRVKTRG